MKLLSLLMIASFLVTAQARWDNDADGPKEAFFGRSGEYTVDMGTTHFRGVLYREAELTFIKDPGAVGYAVIDEEYLAYCVVEKVEQSLQESFFKVRVSFDVENDGGYNFCTVLACSQATCYEVELGADVGE